MRGPSSEPLFHEDALGALDHRGRRAATRRRRLGEQLLSASKRSIATRMTGSGGWHTLDDIGRRPADRGADRIVLRVVEKITTGGALEETAASCSSTSRLGESVSIRRCRAVLSHPAGAPGVSSVHATSARHRRQRLPEGGARPSVVDTSTLSMRGFAQDSHVAMQHPCHGPGRWLGIFDNRVHCTSPGCRAAMPV